MDVSVVIPCHNYAKTLPRAVSSALLQSAVSQVVVVDDASSDDSVACAQSLCVLDRRVQVCMQEKNLGPGAARNRGALLATGSHIVFLDADDEFVGDFTGVALSCFEQNPDLVVAKCDVEFFDPVKGYVLPGDDPRYAVAVLSSSCGMLMRRDIFLRMGGFPEDSVFRGPAGGEDVAFMQAVMAHFQPLARVETVGYRVWTRSGTHVDKFLANTRLTQSGGVEFVADSIRQNEADKLSGAIVEYLQCVKISLNNN